MRTLATSLFLLLLGAVADAAARQYKPAEQQTVEAVSPLSEAMREGARVLGYRGADTLVLLREGTNDLTCLADDPNRERWHVACYHRDLEAFMARGRVLRREGKVRKQIDRIRTEEIEAGTLAMPMDPRFLYSLTGPEGSFDPKTREVHGAGALYVVYLPYATGDDTGIPEKASRDRPWLMYPGTPWAHIMINKEPDPDR